MTTINETTNYKVFQFLNGNRPVNTNKVQKLKQEIKNGINLLPYCPVVVYAEGDIYKIIDGQHRFTASKELKMPVYYVVCDKLTLVEIAKLNSNSHNWKSKDYLDCFLKLGIEDYKDIKELIDKYGLMYAVACDLLMLGNFKSKGDTLKHFKQGTFKSKYYNDTVVLIESCEDMFGRYNFWNHGYLIEAYRQILEAGKFDPERLRAKIKGNPNLLEKRYNTKEYLFAIERLYNDKNQQRVSIF